MGTAEIVTLRTAGSVEMRVQPNLRQPKSVIDQVPPASLHYAIAQYFPVGYTSHACVLCDVCHEAQRPFEMLQ